MKIMFAVSGRQLAMTRIHTPSLPAGYTPDTRASGHTLLELIIVLSMISLIVTITGSAMRLASRSIDKGEKKTESLERFKASVNIVDSQIRSCLPLFLEDGDKETGKDKGTMFMGSDRSLRFSTGYSLWGVYGGYVEVIYEVVSDDNRKENLNVTERVAGTKYTRTTRLFEGFDSIRFEYFFREPLEDTGVWVNQFSKQGFIPSCVRLNLITGTNRLAVIVPIKAGQAVKRRTYL